MSEKHRVPNFTASEKLHLMRIIANKYASIIEDKKTDRASGENKKKAWLEIASEFNSTSSMNIFRSAGSLRKCYENRKKELRKTLADEKKEMNRTGGGPAVKIPKHETDDILISIVNSKTLVGLQNPFDDDAAVSRTLSAESDVNKEIELFIDGVDETNVNLQNETLEIANISPHISQCSNANTTTETVSHVSWKSYVPSKLQSAVDPALAFSEANEENNSTGETSGFQHSRPLKSRRRPTTVVKTFTSSDVAKKYDLLLDKRLQLVEKQLKHIDSENALIIKKRKLEIELLESEVLLKKKNVNEL